MENFLIIGGRTILLYFLIILIFRIMGKREIGELSIFDLVVFLMLAEMAVTGIEDHKDSILHTIIPMLLLMVIQLTLAYLSLKSQKVRFFLDGKPTIIINHGKIDEQAMKSQRYNFDELMSHLRQKDIKSVSDVEFAILEPSGKLSVIEKNKNQKEKEELQVPLIIDGIIQEENLNFIKQNHFWLRQQLRKLGYEDIKKISLCSFSRGIFFIDLKDDK